MPAIEGSWLAVGEKQSPDDVVASDQWYPHDGARGGIRQRKLGSRLVGGCVRKEDGLAPARHPAAQPLLKVVGEPHRRGEVAISGQAADH